MRQSKETSTYIQHKHGTGFTRVEKLEHESNKRKGRRGGGKRSSDKKKWWTKSKKVYFQDLIHRFGNEFVTFVTFRFDTVPPANTEQNIKKIRRKLNSVSKDHAGNHIAGLEWGCNHVPPHYHILTDYALTGKERNQLENLFKKVEAKSYDIQLVQDDAKVRSYVAKLSKHGHETKPLGFFKGWQKINLPTMFKNSSYRDHLITDRIEISVEAWTEREKCYRLKWSQN